jgi:hypothetical protein
MYGGTSTYIPLKVNMAGVIPVIFASSLLYLPGMLARAVQPARRQQLRLGRTGSTANFTVRATEPLYMALYFGLIIFFTYFYVSITFNPTRSADNMKKYGGFIPGIRAGRADREYLVTCSPGSPSPARSTSADLADPADRLRGRRGRPELPVRRYLVPHHGRCRSRHGEADRGQLQQRNYEGFLR